MRLSSLEMPAKLPSGGARVAGGAKLWTTGSAETASGSPVSTRTILLGLALNSSPLGSGGFSETSGGSELSGGETPKRTAAEETGGSAKAGTAARQASDRNRTRDAERLIEASSPDVRTADCGNQYLEQ